jgi:hypothetical protein
MKIKLLGIILLTQLTGFATNFSSLNNMLSDCSSSFFVSSLTGGCSGFCRYHGDGCFYECQNHFIEKCRIDAEENRANALKRIAKYKEKENRLKPIWENEIKKRKEAGKFICLKSNNTADIQTAVDVETDNDVRTKMYEINGEDTLVSFVHKIGIFQDETYIRAIWPLRRCVIDDNNLRGKFGNNNNNTKLLEYINDNTLGGEIDHNQLSKETKSLLIEKFLKDFN